MVPAQFRGSARGLREQRLPGVDQPVDGPLDFEARVTDADGEAVVAVRGEIDFATAERFWAAIEQAVERGDCLVIDFAQTTFTDSTALAKAMLGLPLMAGEEVIGVLQVGSGETRSFTPQDSHRLELTADRALGTQSRVDEIERAAARVLQRSLLPTDLPELPGIELAARYVPAMLGGVGGDWYDVFFLPSGELCMVIGDVAGHGVHPAVVMGRVRSALRAYALENHRPETILELVDRKLQYFEAGYMVTALCAIADDDLEHVTIACAGHPRPVLATGDGPGALVDVTIDPPLGALSGVRRTATTVKIAPDSVFLLYTDGLFERRGADVDTRLATLQDVVRPASADLVCTRVMHRMIGDEPTVDDVAVLALHRMRDIADSSPA